MFYTYLSKVETETHDHSQGSDLLNAGTVHTPYIHDPTELSHHPILSPSSDKEAEAQRGSSLQQKCALEVCISEQPGLFPKHHNRLSSNS